MPSEARRDRARRSLRARALLLLAVGVGLSGACVEPPPKVAAIPPSGLSLRLNVFGASATEAHRRFQALRQNNPGFSVVREGGDGEVVLGLENDSPRCVPPTALCSFRVAYRVRDNQGAVVASGATNISERSDTCGDLCERALNAVAVKIAEIASAKLKAGPPADDAAAPAAEAGPASSDAGAIVGAPAGSKRRAKDPPGRDLAMCSVGAGPRLPSEEAERRAAQVEALKRLGLLEKDEYDCLRRAYLDRL